MKKDMNFGFFKKKGNSKVHGDKPEKDTGMNKKIEHLAEEAATEPAMQETQNELNEKPSTGEQALQDADSAEAEAIAKLELELADSKDKYLRLLSEFDNYKKRVARERIDMVKMAGTDMLLSVLPVLDDFERAIKAMSEEEIAAQQGVQLIYNKLKNILEGKGVKAMDCVGKPFDSDLHDAITNVQAPTDDLKGMVVDEIERGYYLNDKVLRHAKVIVGS
jgi:molecular chaperone GrpE